MAEIKWIKIVTDIFDDEKVLLIEQVPESDSIIVIWFKLLCLAGKQNNSGVFTINDKIPYTDEMLAAIFRRKLETVRAALRIFEQFGMIEIVNGVIMIPNWGKHQNFDKIEQKTEYMRNYMREYRTNQAKIACKSNSKANSKSNSKANVSSADIDIDKNNNIVVQDTTLPHSTPKKQSNLDPTIAKEIIDYLNAKTGKRFLITTKATQKLISGRLSEGRTFADFQFVIDNRVKAWKGKEMEEYLRPSTLFTPTNFENYLNSNDVAPQKAETKTTYRELD